MTTTKSSRVGGCRCSRVATFSFKLAKVGTKDTPKEWRLLRGADQVFVCNIKPQCTPLGRWLKRRTFRRLCCSSKYRHSRPTPQRHRRPAAAQPQKVYPWQSNRLDTMSLLGRCSGL